MEETTIEKERQINKIISRIEIEKMAPWRQEEWSVLTFEQKLFSLEKYAKLQSIYFKIYEGVEIWAKNQHFKK